MMQAPSGSVQHWLMEQAHHPYGHGLKKLDWLVALAQGKQATYQLGESHPGAAFGAGTPSANADMEQAMALARHILLDASWSPLDELPLSPVGQTAVVSQRLVQVAQHLVQSWRKAGFVAAFGARLVDGRRLYWPWLPPALALRMPLLQWVPTAWLWRPDVGYFVVLDVALDRNLAPLRRFAPSQPPWLGQEAYTAPYPFPWFDAAFIATIGPIVDVQDWWDVLAIALPPEVRMLRPQEVPLMGPPYVGESVEDQALRRLLALYWQNLRQQAWQHHNLWQLVGQSLAAVRQQDGLAWSIHQRQLKVERAPLWVLWGDYLQLGPTAVTRQVVP